MCGTVHSGCSAVPCGFAFPSGTGSCQPEGLPVCRITVPAGPDRSLFRQMTRNGPGFQVIKQGSRYMSFKLCLWGCHWHFSQVLVLQVLSSLAVSPSGCPSAVGPGSQAKGASTVPTPVRVIHWLARVLPVYWHRDGQWSIDRMVLGPRREVQFR